MKLRTLLLLLVVLTASVELMAAQGQPTLPREEALAYKDAFDADLETRVDKLKRFLTAYPASQLAPNAHRRLVDSLIESDASTAAIVAAIDDLLRVDDDYAYQYPGDVGRYADVLLNRRERLDDAERYALMATEALKKKASNNRIHRRFYIEALIGLSEIHIAKGRLGSAIETLNLALAQTSADDRIARSDVFGRLGEVYEKQGDLDRAIESYICARATGGPSAEIASGLRRSFQKRYGSLEGLDERIASGCRAP
jgi:tetratricopeptide (TPR) repeat protein